MLTVFITSTQIPLHVHAVFCHNNYYIIVFPLHVHVHCIHLARGMMRMRIPSIILYLPILVPPAPARYIVEVINPRRACAARVT